MKPVIAMLLAVFSFTAAHAAWTLTRITDDFDHNDQVIARSDVVFGSPYASPADTLSIQRACERSNGGGGSNNLLEVAYCKRSVRYNPTTDRFEWIHSESRP